MILTILILLPLVGAAVAGFVPSQAAAKLTGLGFSLGTLLLGVYIAGRYALDGGESFAVSYEWISLLGAHYALSIDGLSLAMVLLTCVLVPIVIAASWREVDQPGNGGGRSFVVLALSLQALSLAVFTASDLLLFYVVFEATLIPAYFLVGAFGREGRSRAAIKFLLYQLAGGLVMLASVLGIYVVSANAGQPTYLLSELAGISIDPITQRWLFVGFFFAFAAKAPLFPLHTWLADTTEKASTGTSVLLVCILDKIGTYAMIRFCLGLLPEASQWASPVVIVLALISIVYGALVAIGQDDLLRLVGLTSLSHFGFIVLGIFVLSESGISGAMLYMVNHGFATAALFVVAGYLVQRKGTASIREISGVERSAPVLAGTLLVALLAACGLPGLSPFVSEILVIIAAFDYAWWTGAVAVSAIVLAAVYALWTYQRTMTGSEPTDVRDLSRREVGVVAPLLLALVVFGFYPMPLLDVINETATTTVTQAGFSDDATSVDGGAP